MGRRRKKKKNAFIFAWISDLKAGFPTAFFPAASPNAAVPSAREWGREGGAVAAAPNTAPQGFPFSPTAAGRTAVFTRTCHTGERPSPTPGRAAPRPRCWTTTTPAGEGGQRHRSAAPGLTAARGRRAAASGPPSSTVPPPTRSSLPAPQRRPVIVAAGGRVNPGSRFLRVPFRQRRRASGPTSGAGSPRPAAILGQRRAGLFCRHLECVAQGAAISVVATVQSRPAPRSTREGSWRGLPAPHSRGHTPPCGSGRGVYPQAQ